MFSIQAGSQTGRLRLNCRMSYNGAGTAVKFRQSIAKEISTMRKILPVMAAVLGLLSAHALVVPSGVMGWPQKAQRQQQQEDQEDYFKKWLNEDVVHLITSAELNVFNKLESAEEKEQFIEQFWYRRDPDLRTAVNEFKEEHYRRIAYSNERFTSGIPGWKTDRGRIYIIHGPPAEVEKHRSGESYQRPSHEGGGFTAVFPFEIWRYRYIEGIGTDIELEFVDPSGSGEFRLARDASEKDAFLFTPGTGLTTAESLGLAARDERPYFQPARADRYPGMSLRSKDDPFTRYSIYARMQRPRPVKYKDLQQIVDTRVGFNTLPFDIRTDYFSLNESNVLVPITFELDNRNLTFQQENGLWVARVAVYGIVTSITNRIVLEFDDDLIVSYRPEHLETGRHGRSIYQKVISIDRKIRHKVDLVLKDLASNSVGVQRKAIIAPQHSSAKLALSSVILTDYVRRVSENTPLDEMFVIGDLKVRPNLRRSFSHGRSVAVYLHVYNATVDQSTLRPSLALRYRVTRDGKQIKYWFEEQGESIQFESGQRVVVLKNLHAETLSTATYRLEVEIEDQLSEDMISVDQTFEITPVAEAVSGGSERE